MKTKTPEFTFTSSQLAAIRLDASRVAVVAGPGSGKSTVLVERIRRLIEAGADPRSIFVVTFTNAAARVVEKRLKRLGLNTQLGYAGTLHGLALRLCKAHHHLIPGLPAKISVMNKEQASEFLSDTCIDLQATGTLKAIREAVKNMTILNVIQGAKNVNLIAASYYRRMIRSGLLDFDSILMLAAYICGRLTRDNIVLCQHLLWDEIQDSGFYDHCILSESLAANKFVVGDQDQCQPAGTMIRMADGMSEKPIEAIKSGDAILTYGRREKVILKNGVVSATAKRPYRGPIYTVTAGTRIAESTGNHKWLIKWATGNERSMGSFCTYLMRKGDNFRVGKTRFFRSAGKVGHVIGIALRMYQEGADSIWVLKVHSTDEEATAYEQIIAANYGLPEVCFKASNQCVAFTQDVIEEIYANIPHQLAKAIRCLSDHGRLLEYPLIDRSHKRTRRTVQEIHACNLIDDIMSVPVAHDAVNYKNRAGQWIPIKVSAREFSGMVYSLDVSTHHKYISNGLITCNSAYQFRGATPDLFVKILTRGQWALIKLEDNFRCGPSICQAANKLIAHNKDRMEKQTLAVDREREDAVLYRHYKTEAEETRMLATQIMYNQASMEWSEMAVLVPYNDLAQRYADALQAHGIPVAMRKDAAIPIDWSRTLRLLALISNPDNDFLMYRWLVKTQDVKKADAAKLRALKQRCSINHWLPPEQSFSDNLELAKVPQYLARFNVQTDSMAIVERVMQELPADASITELCQALADQDLFLTDEGTGVTVTTFHSAKGREWSAVWMPAFEEGFCPRLGASNDLQEERRLAYIGFTRAREYLSVSSAGKRRPIWGREGGKPEEERVASRFVGESGLLITMPVSGE